MLCAYERPEDHPSISVEELAYINKGKDYGRTISSDGDRIFRAVEAPLHQPLAADTEADVSLLDGEYTTLSRRHSDDRMRQLSTSVVSVEGGVGESEGTRANDQVVLSDEIPWAAIFTSPAVLTLFVQGWCYVSWFESSCTLICW